MGTRRNRIGHSRRLRVSHKCPASLRIAVILRGRLHAQRDRHDVAKLAEQVIHAVLCHMALWDRADPQRAVLVLQCTDSHRLLCYGLIAPLLDHIHLGIRLLRRRGLQLHPAVMAQAVLDTPLLQVNLCEALGAELSWVSFAQSLERPAPGLELGLRPAGEHVLELFARVSVRPIQAKRVRPSRPGLLHGADLELLGHQKDSLGILVRELRQKVLQLEAFALELWGLQFEPVAAEEEDSAGL